MKNRNSCTNDCGKILLQVYSCMKDVVFIRASNGKMCVSGREKLTITDNHLNMRIV